MASVYEPEKLKEEATRNMLIMDTALRLEALTRLLISKGIVSKVEMDYMREELMKDPKYQAGYKMAEEMMKAAELYEQNPQAYLRGLFDAKLKGNIR